LIFVLSAANTDLYIGSRTLYGLAVEGNAPAFFRKVNRAGVPWPALILCTSFSFIVYLNVSSSSQKVFGWFVNLVSTFGAITWMCIVWTHIRFMGALKRQGISRDDLPYKAPFQPWGSWFTLIATGIITLFKGFDTFIPFTTDTFITAYIALPVFAVLYLSYKIWFKTKLIPLDQVDLISGKREIDEEEKDFVEEQESHGPQPWWKRAFNSL